MDAPLNLLAPRSSPSTRERELEMGRLVLRAWDGGNDFLIRRAADAVRALPSGPARRGLGRAVQGLTEGDVAALKSGLLAYGAVLERHGLYPAAWEVYEAVLAGAGGDGVVALHAARAARKTGARAEALRLYGMAAARAAGDEELALLARIGEALVSEAPIAALGPVLRSAGRAGVREAVAVGREERARLNRAAGRTGRAIRDLLAAARWYTDRTDRLRVLYVLAELLSARGDLSGAREALLAALELSDARSRGHTVQRLRSVARASGDELELRRSRGAGTASLVTLMPGRSRPVASARSLAPRLRRWRGLLSDRSGRAAPRGR